MLQQAGGGTQAPKHKGRRFWACNQDFGFGDWLRLPWEVRRYQMQGSNRPCCQRCGDRDRRHKPGMAVGTNGNCILATHPLLVWERKSIRSYLNFKRQQAYLSRPAIGPSWLSCLDTSQPWGCTKLFTLCEPQCSHLQNGTGMWTCWSSCENSVRSIHKTLVKLGQRLNRWCQVTV